jgi:hypothetical protein
MLSPDLTMLQRIRNLLHTPGRLFRRLVAFESRLESMQRALGSIQARLDEQSKPSNNLWDHEFRVFSQWGEDGILDYLVRRIPGLDPSFIEFGIEDYQESNTRYLLQERSWKGLVIDGDPLSVTALKCTAIHARHTLIAACHFVTRENINDLFRQHGFTGNLGILSIDVDGMDYWLWEAVNVVQPAIVVIEFNAMFGAEAKIVVPYKPDFQRFKAHGSGIYAGASLAALEHLANKKGFALVGTNRAGNNAFFVENSRLGPLPRLTAVQAFTPPKFREARDHAGRMAFLSNRDSLKLVDSLPVFDLAAGRERPIRECVQDLERLEKF